jgi:ribosomal protein L21E
MPVSFQSVDIVTLPKGIRPMGLNNYSALLKKYQPGDLVKLVVDCNSEMKEIELELGER